MSVVVLVDALAIVALIVVDVSILLMGTLGVNVEEEDDKLVRVLIVAASIVPKGDMTPLLSVG